jgi:hypothetical protein
MLNNGDIIVKGAITMPFALARFSSLFAFCICLALFECKLCAGEEFIGPLAGWTNLKSVYGAKGDGKTDDTASFQAAFKEIGTAGHSSILYIPSGTYLISSTLSVESRVGISILGEDPSTTVVKWVGPVGGTMVSINGVAYSRYGRITWDGNRAAETIWWDWWDGNHNYFPTHNEHADEVFENCEYGLRGGQMSSGGDAEMSVLRCKFLSCSTAGVSVENFNTLDWFIWYSEFDRCGYGATNSPPKGGAGNFHVYYSVFRQSKISDIGIGNTGYFSARNNFSIGSKAFFYAAFCGSNAAMVTLQRNTVVDAKTAPVQIWDAGPLMLIDNSFRQATVQTGPMVFVGVGTSTTPPSQDDTFSIGNKFGVAKPDGYKGISVTGRLRSIDDTSVGKEEIESLEPAVAGALPNMHRHIIELGAAADGAAIQQAILLADKYKGQRPVIHIAAGNHDVEKTIVFPAHCDVQLVGDGFLQGTVIAGAQQGITTVLDLKSPSRVTLRDLAIKPQAGSNGIEIEENDLPGDRVFIEQGAVDSAGEHGLFVDGVDNIHVELHDFYHDSIDGTGIMVLGGSRAKAGLPAFGTCDLYGGGSSNEGTTYSVADDGRLMAQDIWYEAHPTIATFLKLSGSGVFTLQAGEGAVVAKDGVAGMDFDGFSGRAALLGLNLNTNYSGIPFKAAVEPTTEKNAHILFIGSMGDSGKWLENKSGAAEVSELNCKKKDVNGSALMAESGSADSEFIKSLLNQTRTEYPEPWPLQALPAKNSDVRMYRTEVGGAKGVDDIKISGNIR